MPPVHFGRSDEIHPQVFLSGYTGRDPLSQSPHDEASTNNNDTALQSQSHQLCIACQKRLSFAEPPRISDSVEGTVTAVDTEVSTKISEPDPDSTVAAKEQSEDDVPEQVLVSSLDFEQVAREQSKPAPSVGTTRVSSGPCNYNSTFYMVTHLPKGGKKMHLAKLDTGSNFDIISRQLLDDFKLTEYIEEYYGGGLDPLGESITPLGIITLDWHIRGQTKTYTTTWVVLDHYHTRGFDCLLSCMTVTEIGFYKINEDVWHFD